MTLFLYHVQFENKEYMNMNMDTITLFDSLGGEVDVIISKIVVTPVGFFYFAFF
jgi:hypothetical protein